MIHRLLCSLVVALILVTGFAGSSYGQSGEPRGHGSWSPNFDVATAHLDKGMAVEDARDPVRSAPSRLGSTPPVVQHRGDWPGHPSHGPVRLSPKDFKNRPEAHVAPQPLHRATDARIPGAGAALPASPGVAVNQEAPAGPADEPGSGPGDSAPPGLPGVSSADQDTDPLVTSWLGFDGAESTWNPADPAIAVGPDHVVAAVNTMFDSFDKQGRLVVPGPHIPLDAWFEDILAGLNIPFVIVAPQTLYDPIDDRYIIAARANNLQRKQSVVVFSVSETGDPSGDWCGYIFGPTLTSQGLLPLMVGDLTLAVNRDALYFTSGLYEVVDSAQGTRTNFDRSRASFLAKSIYYQPGCAPDSEQSWTNVDLVDTAGNDPESVRATPNLDGTDAVYLASTLPVGGDVINVWSGRTRARNASPLNGSLSANSIPVGDYDRPPKVDQRGTGERIDTGDARLTSSAYRDSRLWLAHAVACASDRTHACYKWYTLNPTTRNVVEDGFWALTGGHYFTPAVLPDGNGEPVVVVNTSATDRFVSVGFSDGRGHAYRLPDSGPGTGTACYDDGRGNPSSVWGFTNGIALDPVRGTVWGHAAFAAGSSASDCGRNDWRTVVFEVSWPNRPGESGITGKVYFKGNPEGGAELELVEYDGQNTTTVATTTTEADGGYIFTGVPSLPSGSIYFVAYTNPLAGSPGGQDNDRLQAWFSTSIRSYRAGESADGGSFDIANVALEAPAHGARVPFGTTFRWRLRSGAYRAAEDNFYIRWLQGEPPTALGHTGPTRNASLRIDSQDLPAGMSANVLYNWTIRICRDPECDEVGFARFRQAVTFEIDAPTATPPPTTDDWRIGVPIVANREFRGVYAGGGRYAERRGSISGRANSAVQIQNLDGNSALNATTYYLEQPDPYLGNPSVAPPQHVVDLRNIAAGGASNMYLPSLNLPSGLFSAAIESNGPIMTAAIARTDWSTGGAGIYGNVSFSDRLVVPLVVRNYYGLSSIVSIMADGPATTRARVDFFRSGDSTPLAGPRYTISPWAAVTFDVNDALADLDRLGSGFLGAAVITVEGSGKVGAASLVYSEINPLAVSAFEAIPAVLASDTLYAPLFRSRQRGVGPGDRLDTGISVFNPQVSPADVTVTYYPTDSASASAACRGQRSYTHGPVRVAANSSYVFYQGPGGGHGLPEDCFGSAVVRTASAASKVLAIVNDSTNGSQLTAAYNAISGARAHTKIAVPLFRNEHLAQRFTTGIQVMNVGSRPARVEISFARVEGSNSVPITGCGGDCLAFVDPNRSYTWYPPAIRAIGANTYGSATIKSDEPVVAIVNDYPLAGGVDAAIYNGIAVFDQPGGGASSHLGRRSEE